MEEDYISKLSNYIKKSIDDRRNIRSDLMYSTMKNRYPYTYRNHKNLEGEDYFLHDFPTEWIPDYHYIHQELVNSMNVGVRIYDNLWDFSEEQLVNDFKTSKFADYYLIILTDEITGGRGPSFIELVTASDKLNANNIANSPWNFKYWANIMSNGICTSTEKSTIIELIDHLYEKLYTGFANIMPHLDSIIPFDDSVTAHPYVLEMYSRYRERPGDKLEIIEYYKPLTNLPRVCLWYIINVLDELPDQIGVETLGEYNRKFFERETLTLLIHCNYLVYTIRELIDSYKEAYPNGYFVMGAKNARSAR